MNKIDSNITGLRFAVESTLKTLPGSPVWNPLEPNSYSDFGGQIATVNRNPINASRQMKKGVVTDLDAMGGFNQDLTFGNTISLLQGFFFADIREKVTTAGMNDTPVALSAVDAATKTVSAAAGLEGFELDDLVLFEGFGVTANNGLKTVSADSTGVALVTVEALADEAAPPATAKATVVGKQFGVAELDITLNGNLVRLESATVDMATLGLIAGEWVYVGGDAAANRFANNVGFARIGVIGTDYLEFDKTTFVGVAEAGAGKNIQLFFGAVLKNESDSTLIKRRTYQLERTLGNDDDGVMSEYVVGAVANQLTLNIAQADKVTVDLGFVGLDNEQRAGSVGVKAGARPALVSQDAFNTTSDITRSSLAAVDETDSSVNPLFAFATDMSITINNSVTANKAIGTLGGFDTTAGNFMVGGSITAYFADIEAVRAVRNNADIQLDILMQKANQALLWDIPLLSLGGGRLSVQQDQAITIPLETTAAESKFGHTLLLCQFGYLPNVAGGV